MLVCLFRLVIVHWSRHPCLIVFFCISPTASRRLTSSPLRRGHAAARRGLQPICERLDCSPYELMLSWLLQIDDCIIPVPGATRVPTIASIAACARFEFPLQDEEIVQFLRPQDG